MYLFCFFFVTLFTRFDIYVCMDRHSVIEGSHDLAIFCLGALVRYLGAGTRRTGMRIVVMRREKTLVQIGTLLI